MSVPFKENPSSTEGPLFFKFCKQASMLCNRPQAPPSTGTLQPHSPRLQPAQLPQEPLQRAGQLPEARAIQSLSGVVQTAAPGMALCSSPVPAQSHSSIHVIPR